LGVQAGQCTVAKRVFGVNPDVALLFDGKEAIHTCGENSTSNQFALDQT